ncbi:MAG TPA: ATP-binding protein, partial [Anaeromyxobacteraceae bacterium]
GEVRELVAAFNAMTADLAASRERAAAAERVAAWREVARRLAHEIKNPLTPIQLAFQQLEARGAALPARDPDFARLLAEAGEIVREEIGTLQRLVDEFSGFARLPEVRAEPADLAEFVEDFRRTSPLEGADLEVAAPGGPLPVSLDRALMRRVLANLCRNAVEAARPERARVRLELSRRGNQALLVVEDRGPGLPAAGRERLFDPYFTTKPEGTGLGLAVVRKIVLQHGGDVAAADRPGGGARFTVALPLARS